MLIDSNVILALTPTKKEDELKEQTTLPNHSRKKRAD